MSLRTQWEGYPGWNTCLRNIDYECGNFGVTAISFGFPGPSTQRYIHEKLMKDWIQETAMSREEEYVGRVQSKVEEKE